MLKNLKKYLILSLTAFMAFGLGLASMPSVNAAEPIQVNFWYTVGGANGEALQDIIDNYNASQNEVFINGQYQGSYGEVQTKLKAAAAGGNLDANLIQAGNMDQAFMLNTGLFVPMQELIDQNNFNLTNLEENILAFYKINDQLYSMPFNASTPILYYNKDMFEAAGITEIPENMYDVIAISKDLVENGGASMAMSLQIRQWYIHEWFMTQGLDMFNNEDGRSGKATETVFMDNGGLTNILQMHLDAYNSGYIPNVGRDGGKPEFLSGESAMTILSTASVRQILEEVGDRFEVGTAYFPKLTAEDSHGVAVGGASLWLTNVGDAEVNNAAWKFIEYLTSPEVQAEWSVNTGYFPINVKAYDEKVLQDNLEEFPIFKTAIDQLHDSSIESVGPVTPIWQEAADILNTSVERVLAGEMTPEEAAQEAADKMDQASQEYYQVNQ